MLSKLPDFVSKKVDMLTAARSFKAAIDKNCKRMGMDPDWETNICLYKEYGMYYGNLEFDPLDIMESHSGHTKMFHKENGKWLQL